jgi:hypothetical protein
VRPHADPVRGQARGYVRGGHTLDIDQECRHPAVHPGPPVHGNRRRQPGKEPLAERALIRRDRRESADRVEVIDRRVEPGEQLVRQRAGLETAAERASGRGPRLVRPPLLEHRCLAERDAKVRAAELVRRADQHIGADVADVDRLVRGVVHGVDPGQRADLVRERTHPLRVHERADRVRRPGERHYFRPRAELALQVGDVERGVVVQRDVPDQEVLVPCEL